MKVIHDDELSELHKYTQRVAKNLCKLMVEETKRHIWHHVKNDIRFGDLTYPGLMTFINTISTRYFVEIFYLSCEYGKQFPDVEHSTRDLFEETIRSIRILSNMPDINIKEHPGGIKKIGVTE